jgi:hypothetical protein
MKITETQLRKLVREQMDYHGTDAPPIPYDHNEIRDAFDQGRVDAYKELPPTSDDKQYMFGYRIGTEELDDDRASGRRLSR